MNKRSIKDMTTLDKLKALHKSKAQAKRVSNVLKIINAQIKKGNIKL